jgi:hypothetical protein
LRKLLTLLSNLGLGNASMVAAELMAMLQALLPANTPAELVSRVESMEAIFLLMGVHYNLVTSTVDQLATDAGGGAVVYKSCPALPTRDLMCNLIISLCAATNENSIIASRLDSMNTDRKESFEVMASRIKQVGATFISNKKPRTGEAGAGQSHAMMADAAQYQDMFAQQQQQHQVQQVIAHAAQQQQMAQQQQVFDQQLQQQQQQMSQQQPFIYVAHQQQQQQPFAYVAQQQQQLGWQQQQPTTMAFAAQLNARPPIYGRSPGPCYAFQKGECSRGDSCRFSHVSDPSAGRGASSATATATAAPMTQACTFFQDGRCSQGDNCRFRHDRGVQPRLPGTLGANFRGAGGGGM